MKQNPSKEHLSSRFLIRYGKHLGIFAEEPLLYFLSLSVGTLMLLASS